MSDETETGAPTRETPREALAAELGRYGDALLPGAAEIIAERNQELAQLSPARRAEKVAELIESPLWKNFRNPEFAPARLESGQPLSPLRAALSRHAPELKPGAVDALTTAWSAGLSHLTPARLAGEVVRRLATREARDHLVNPAPLPEYEDRISGLALHHFRDVLSPAAADRLAAERAHDWRDLSERDAVATIAKLLRSGLGAARYGARALPEGDARLQPNRELSIERPRYGPGPAKAEPARQADGRFSDAPAKRRGQSSF